MRTLNCSLWLAAVALTACTGSDDVSDVAERSDALVESAAAMDALGFETAMLDDTAERAALVLPEKGPARWWVARPVYKLLKRWGGVASADCVHQDRWVDDDGDGLPRDTTAKFDCEAKADRGMTWVRGAARVLDADDSDANAGFYMELSELSVLDGFVGGIEHATIADGFASVAMVQRMDGIPGLARNMRLRTFERYPTGFASARTLFMQGKADYAADPHAARFDRFAAGKLVLAGRWTLETGGRTRYLSVQTKPTLHWDRDCASKRPQAPGFDAGRLVVADPDGRDVWMTFVGCGAWRTTTDTAVGP